ncbi:MAG: helix-turn-helix domain-containing protein [Agriterribacter sp.]
MLVLYTNTYLGNVVNASQSDGFSIGRVCYGTDGSFDEMHCHENPHFSLVVSGGNIEKRQGTSFERLPGRITFYHAGEAHQNTYQVAGSSHVNVEITSSYLRNNSLNISHTNTNPSSHRDAAMLILKMYKESLTADAYSADTMKMLLLELLTNDGSETSYKPAWANELQALLNDRWNETPTLDELSKVAGVHPVTISKHFTRYFGCTLGVYMRKQKVVRAIALMKKTNATLTGIAYECGFADQSHFIRTFKQLTGLLPGEYQRL